MRTWKYASPRPASGRAEASGVASSLTATGFTRLYDDQVPAVDESNPRRRRLVVVGILTTCLLAAGGFVAFGGGSSSQTDGGKVSQQIKSLSQSVATAWFPYQGATGVMRLPARGLNRFARNTAYYGAALLMMAQRQPTQAKRAEFTKRGVLAVNHAIDNSAKGSPFTFLAAAIAYVTASRELADIPQVANALPAWGTWLNQQRRSDAQTKHDCFANPDCYNNWDLIRALAVVEALRAKPVGAKVKGAFLDNRQATRDWLKGIFNHDVPKSIGPQPDTDWSLGASGVLSDPPMNPSAYHQLSSALLTEARSVSPGLFSKLGTATAKRVSRYSKALVAPNGDVAQSGRSQLQSWTLAAALLTAAHGVGGKYDATWRAVGQRVLDRLSSERYRDPTGVFAITPSARSQTLDGIDRYAAPADYNGLTLMLLELAARAWTDGGTAGQVPTDRTGLFADLHGSHLVIGREPDLWWQWQTRPEAGVERQDFRSDAGLIQVQSKSTGSWLPLLAARPLSAIAKPAGPALVLKGVSHPFVVRSVKPINGGAELRGVFRSPTGMASVSSVLTVREKDQGLVISWPITAGQSYKGTIPLVGGKVSQGRLLSKTSTVVIRPRPAYGKPQLIPSANSVFTRVCRWVLVAKSNGTAEIRINPR